MQNKEANTTELNQKDRLSLLIRQLSEKKRGVVLLLEGSGIHGIQYVIKKLTETLDPRHFRLYHMPEKAGLENCVPFLYEYWQALPGMGDLAIFDRSYYYKLGLGLLDGSIKKKEREKYLIQLADFERTLQDNGYLVYKIYLSTTHKRLKKEFDQRRKLKADVPRFLRDRFKARLQRFKKLGKQMHTLIDDAGERSLWVSPWGQINFTRKRDAMEQAFGLLIDWLERDLEIESIAAVKEFDQAMARVRARRMIEQTDTVPALENTDVGDAGTGQAD